MKASQIVFTVSSFVGNPVFYFLGVHHGHTGHVRFLTSVQMGAAGSEERGVAESKERGVVPPTEGETTQKGETLNDEKGRIYFIWFGES